MSALLIPTDTIELTRQQIELLSDESFIALLSAARLTVACPKCLAAGHTISAVARGSNGIGDARWKIECQCTTRLHRRGLGS